MSDRRNLFALNREERRQYLAGQRKLPAHLKETRVINLLRTIEVTDGDGTIINNKEGKLPTLKEICQFALRAACQSDQSQDFKAKNDRYLILKRVDAAEESIELTEGEIKLIKDRIGKLYMQVGIVGRAAELLDGKE